MAVLTKPEWVDNPTPAATRYGLFTAATGPLPLPVHARSGGIIYNDPITLFPAGMEVVCEEQTITFNDGCGANVTGTPFYVISTLHTGSQGLSQQEIRDRLLAQLLLNEQSVVESVFSQGTFGQANSLANNATAPTALAAAATMQDAIGNIEEWFTSVTSRRGIIHLPAVLAPYLSSECSAYREGGRWYTPTGNVISIGNYSGLDPNGDAAAAGHTTVYACESTTVWRTPDSSILFSPYEGNLDIGTIPMGNQLNALAIREYVVTHNNVFASIDVTI